MSNKVIVALDNLEKKAALQLAEKLSGLVWGFKVNDLLVEYGVDVIRELKQFGSVFADPKLYDIPNTVQNSVNKLQEAGADLITVHASCGKKGLEAAASSAGISQILAVTVLTSFAEEDSQAVFQRSSKTAVFDLASLAFESGVRGIVCSAEELSLFQTDSRLKTLIKVTPGIRPSWYAKADDQSRTMTPRAAIDAGADLLVLGRPITEHADPKAAVRLIAEELEA